MTVVSTIIVCVFALLPWCIFGRDWMEIWSTHVDHCSMVACDFQRHYLPQVHMVANQDWRIQPGWYYPPIVAMLLLPFAWISNPVVVWMGCNLLLVLVAAMVVARIHIVSIYKRPTELWQVLFALALMSTSFPILHSLKWGQISIAIVLLSTWSLLQNKEGQTPRSVVAAIVFGLAISLKWYPVVYLCIPVVEKRWKWIRMVFLSVVVWSVCIPWFYVGQHTWWYMENSLAAGVEIQGVASFGGGQSIIASATRWFVNGSHVGITSSVGKYIEPVIFVSDIGYFVTIAVYAIFSIWVMLWKYKHKEQPIQLILVMLLSQLWLSPGWHHYFAFFPLAMFWLWKGIDRDKGTYIWSLISIGLCFLVERIPMLVLCYSRDDSGYEWYSQLGMTTLLTTMLVMVATIGTTDIE